MSEQAPPPVPGFEPPEPDPNRCSHDDCPLVAAEHALGYQGCSYPEPES